MVGTKGAAADCWHDWSVPGATLVEALAHYVGMPEFEPISGSKISKEWCHTSCEKLRDFLRLEDFSVRVSGCYFTAAGTARAISTLLAWQHLWGILAMALGCLK